MLLLSPLLLLLGMFLPGLFLARFLKQRIWWAAAFPFSLVVLFHCIFWPGVFGIPLRLWTVLPLLVGVSAVFAWLGRAEWRAPALPSAGKQGWTRTELVLIVSSAVVGVALAVRVAITPLTGLDTLFRWDFLAQQMLALGRFDFYPPLTAADFRNYFYVDGIPPMVSFAHWWMYAAVGQRVPGLIAVFVTAQFAAILLFTYGAAAALVSRRAGVVAAAILAASPLYFRSIVIGQETGLTALAVAATLYFIVSAPQPKDARAMVAAGFAAALCALSREYGWIALIAGAIALLWRRQSRRDLAVFVAVAAVAGAPWYVRNLLRTGNPFYSLNVAGFPVNPVHDGIMQGYRDQLSISHWTGQTLMLLAGSFLAWAIFQVVAGVPGAVADFRRRGYLGVIALLLVAVWLESVALTSAGLESSTRVLSPALVVLSISGALLLEGWMRREKWQSILIGGIVLSQLFTVAHAALYPSNPSDVPADQWAARSFRDAPLPMEFQLHDQLLNYLPPGSRVLSDNAYLYAALIGNGVEVVPVWSPEVSFLFTAPPEEAERRLRELRISSVVFYPRSLNTAYLTAKSPMYAAMPRRWRVRAQVPGMLAILAPPES